MELSFIENKNIMKKSKTVDEYINSSPKEIQGKLRELRTLVKSVAPEATEKISYGMPYYGYNGRLFYFAYFKDHISVFIMRGVLGDFEKEVRDYKTGAATLRFALDKKLPLPLIKKLIRATIKKSEAKTY